MKASSTPVPATSFCWRRTIWKCLPTLPTGWTNSSPDPASHTRCTAFCAAGVFCWQSGRRGQTFSFCCFRRKPCFHKSFTFLFLKPLQQRRHNTITALSQHRFRSVSVSPVFIPIFFLFLVVLLDMPDFFAMFLGTLSDFWRIFAAPTPC